MEGMGRLLLLQVGRPATYDKVAAVVLRAD